MQLVDRSFISYDVQDGEPTFRGPRRTKFKPMSRVVKDRKNGLTNSNSLFPPGPPLCNVIRLTAIRDRGCHPASFHESHTIVGRVSRLSRFTHRLSQITLKEMAALFENGKDATTR